MQYGAMVSVSASVNVAVTLEINPEPQIGSCYVTGKISLFTKQVNTGLTQRSCATSEQISIAHDFSAISYHHACCDFIL